MAALARMNINVSYDEEIGTVSTGVVWMGADCALALCCYSYCYSRTSTTATAPMLLPLLYDGRLLLFPHGLPPPPTLTPLPMNNSQNLQLPSKVHR